jgi:hypothetical protein
MRGIVQALDDPVPSPNPRVIAIVIDHVVLGAVRYFGGIQDRSGPCIIVLLHCVLVVRRVQWSLRVVGERV